MITKKTWNQLSPETRMRILTVIDANDPMADALAKEPFKHDFEFNEYGLHLKDVLSKCYSREDGIQVNTLIKTV